MAPNSRVPGNAFVFTRPVPDHPSIKCPPHKFKHPARQLRRQIRHLAQLCFICRPPFFDPAQFLRAVREMSVGIGSKRTFVSFMTRQSAELEKDLLKSSSSGSFCCPESPRLHLGHK